MIPSALYGNSRWVACAIMLACSSSDATSPEGLENGANPDPVPAAGGSENVAPGATAGGSGAGGSSAGGEGQNEDVVLGPAQPGEPNMPTVEPDVPFGNPVQGPLPDLLSVRQEHAVVALDGEIYVIGGFTPNVTATVEAFDPNDESWRSVADFPFPLHHANAATVNGKLYVAGFYLGGSFTDADGGVFEYDPELDSWSERAVMPFGSERASSCVATFDGKIYLFGGARSGSVSDASAYDVESNSWQALPALPEAREHCLAGEIDGTLYIAAGRSGGIGGFEPNTWAFDPSTETYTARAPIATPRGGAAGAVLRGRLYVLGGEGNPADPSGVFSNVEAYDPSNDTWQVLPAMLTPRHGLGAAAITDRIYLPGGAGTQGFGAASDHSVLRFEAPAP